MDYWDWRRGPAVRLALELFELRQNKLPRMKDAKLARWEERARHKVEDYIRSEEAYPDVRGWVKAERTLDRIRWAAVAELLAGEIRWRKGGDLPFR